MGEQHKGHVLIFLKYNYYFVISKFLEALKLIIQNSRIFSSFLSLMDHMLGFCVGINFIEIKLIYVSYLWLLV